MGGVVSEVLMSVYNENFDLPVEDPSMQPVFISVWDDLTQEPLRWFTMKMPNILQDTPIELSLPLLTSDNKWVQVDQPCHGKESLHRKH